MTKAEKEAADKEAADKAKAEAEAGKTTDNGPAPQSKVETIKPPAIPVAGEIEKINPEDLTNAEDGKGGESGINWGAIAIIGFAAIGIAAFTGWYIARVKHGPKPATGGDGKQPAA
jgi:hypothetical protein